MLKHLCEVPTCNISPGYRASIRRIYPEANACLRQRDPLDVGAPPQRTRFDRCVLESTTAHKSALDIDNCGAPPRITQQRCTIRALIIAPTAPCRAKRCTRIQMQHKVDAPRSRRLSLRSPTASGVSDLRHHARAYGNSRPAPRTCCACSRSHGPGITRIVCSRASCIRLLHRPGGVSGTGSSTRWSVLPQLQMGRPGCDGTTNLGQGHGQWRAMPKIPEAS